MNNYKIDVCSPDEARVYLRQLARSDDGFPALQLKGFVDAVCRNEDGSTAWEHHQPNLVTNYGLSAIGWTGAGAINTMYIITLPTTEAPDPQRCLIPVNGVTPFLYRVSPNLYKIFDAPSNTMTWVTSFAAPAALTNIGAIGITNTTRNNGTTVGVSRIVAYTVLPSVKVETTVQTLEVQYKLTGVAAY